MSNIFSLNIYWLIPQSEAKINFTNMLPRNELNPGWVFGQGGNQNHWSQA
jgi:hypothetical protein